RSRRSSERNAAVVGVGGRGGRVPTTPTTRRISASAAGERNSSQARAPHRRDPRMNLDLLYEFEVAEPWPGEHPYGQRAAEQRVYRECLEQLTFADTLGFDTAWLVEHHFRKARSHMPCSEAVLGALSQLTERLKLGFGVTLMPHGFIHPARVA